MRERNQVERLCDALGERLRNRSDEIGCGENMTDCDEVRF
jgi:hypothetical protein